jgi:hypothetical protein
MRHRLAWTILALALLAAFRFAAPWTFARSAATPGIASVGTPLATANLLHVDVQFQDTILAATPGALNAGDRIILRDRLLQGGQTIGHDAGVCTITDPAGEALCNVVYVLPDGTIARQFVNAPPPEKTFAIIGGTGRYAGARGTGTLVEHPDQTGVLKLQLVP